MPSQTQIYFDQNTLYTRFDPSGSAGGGVGVTISYYGYSAPDVQDTANVFSIKKVYSLNGVQYQDWSNNTVGNFEVSWVNRSYYFATPSNISSLSVTVSGTSLTTNGGSVNVITFNWIAATGSSRYYATFLRGNTLIDDINNSGNFQYNPYNNSYNKLLINQTSVSLNNCPNGYTYSINLVAFNGIGVSPTASLSISI